MMRPQSCKIYDPTNPEYQLASMYSEETFRIVSPNIIYWKLNKNLTDETRDEVDKLYGENSQKAAYDKPVQIFAQVEISPIINELARLGLEQKDEIIMLTNIIDVNARLQAIPKQGDILRIDYISPGTPDYHKFYVVNRVLPDTNTMYNFCFINYLIHCENTALSDVPEEVKYSKILE
jgi:hypothetical protein